MLVLLILLLALAALPLFAFFMARRIEAAVPPLGRFVDVPGARLHVLEKGEGPTVLLIHGLAGNLRHFSYGLMDLLATRYRVVAVDRPGAGYSTRAPGASASLHAQADVMAALIEALQLDRPLVVGHSLGGAISLALAQRHPERLRGLALIAPLTHPPHKPPSVFDGLLIPSAALRRLVAWTLATPLGLLKSGPTLEIVFAPEAVCKGFAIRGGGALGLRPQQFFESSSDVMAAAQDMAAMLQGYSQMKLPVSMLYGRSDALLDPQEQGQALADKLPGMRLELVDGGHMLPLTQVELTANFVFAADERSGSEQAQ